MIGRMIGVWLLAASVGFSGCATGEGPHRRDNDACVFAGAVFLAAAVGVGIALAASEGGNGGGHDDHHDRGRHH
jgi:hypothetical protein